MISAVIVVKNAEKTLPSLLERLKSIDVVLFDTGSTDNTLDLAKKFSNVQIFSKKIKKLHFGALKNEAASLAQNDWILSLDADEVPCEELIPYLLKTSLSKNSVYSFPFHNYYDKKRIYGCGWHPESHIRLYHRKNTQFSNDRVHEKIEVKNASVVKINCPISHYSYFCLADFIDKMQRYSSLFAEQNAHRKSSSFCKAFFHGSFAFFKSYILKRGIFDGKEGLIISWYNASVAFVKYLKLLEKNTCN